jgi:fluoride ion exporter CrcB/FEX
VAYAKTHAPELAWTVAGASAGSFTRYEAGQLWPDAGRGLASTFVVTAGAAVLIGFGLVADLRASIKTVLLAAGAAAASISAVATQAASATPVQSAICLGSFFVCAVTGVPLGMLAAFCVARTERR